MTRSFAKRASDWVLGSMIPSPPCEVGRMRVSHLTLVLASVAFPLQIKFPTTLRTWQHILGFGFQKAARYHIEARSTWFAIRIFPANERRQVLQLISLPLRADNILSKLALGGRWNPIWIPRYLTCRNPTLAKCGGEAQHLEKVRICDALASHEVKPTWGFHKVKLRKVETWKHAPGFQL